jgi:aryl-alcohol dehydrogenase-like predicted oxidoreductase
MRYGVANATGEIDSTAIGEILEQAWDLGVDTLDTAVAYGDAEARLGEIGVAEWSVGSKLPPVPEGERDIVGWVLSTVHGSLERLRIPKLSSFLMHRPRELLGEHGPALLSALEQLKSEGLVSSVGLSIYSPHDLESLLEVFRPDLVQAPFSVVDRRLEASGWLARLKADGTEVHVRSVFLQGLLLLSPRDRPRYFDPWAPLLEAWDSWTSTRGGSRLSACLGFVLARDEIDRVVVGVDSVAQLREILSSCAETARKEPPIELSSEDLGLIDPSRWVLR